MITNSPQRPCPSVDASRHEDWIAEQLVVAYVLITNPELLKNRSEPAAVSDDRSLTVSCVFLIKVRPTGEHFRQHVFRLHQFFIEPEHSRLDHFPLV